MPQTMTVEEFKRLQAGAQQPTEPTGPQTMSVEQFRALQQGVTRENTSQEIWNMPTEGRQNAFDAFREGGFSGAFDAVRNNARQSLGMGDGPSAIDEMISGLATVGLREQDAAPIIANRLGGDVRVTPEGDYVVVKDGVGYFVNKPGVSVTDAATLATFLGPGAAGNVAGRAVARGALARSAPATARVAEGVLAGSGMLGAGANAALYSGVQEAVGSNVNDREVDWGQIGVDAATGFAVQGAFKLLTPVAVNLSRTMGKTVGRAWDDLVTPDGQFTRTARRVLSDAGVDLDSYTPEQIKLANRAMRQYNQYDDAARARAANQEAQGLRPTVASVTQDPADLRLLQNMEANPLADPELDAAARRDFNNRQIANQIDSRFSGDDSRIAGVQQDLLAQRQAESNAVSAQYRRARDLSGDVSVTADVADNIESTLRRRLGRDLSDSELEAIMERYPRPNRANDINILGPDGAPVSTVPGEGSTTTLRSIMEWERSLADVDMSGKARKAVRETVQDAQFQDLMGQESAEAVDAWMLAIAGNETLMGRWDKRSIIGKLVDTEYGRLKVSPDEAANVLFGARDAGLLTKKGTREAMKELRMRLEGNPESWAAVKENFARRLIGANDLIRDIQTPQGDGVRVNTNALFRRAQQAASDYKDVIGVVFKDDPDWGWLYNLTRAADNMSGDVASGSASVGSFLNRMDLDKAQAGLTSFLSRLGTPGRAAALGIDTVAKTDLASETAQAAAKMLNPRNAPGAPLGLPGIGGPGAMVFQEGDKQETLSDLQRQIMSYLENR